MGIEPTSEAWEAVPRIMRLPRELAQICKAGQELACSERCGPRNHGRLQGKSSKRLSYSWPRLAISFPPFRPILSKLSS